MRHKRGSTSLILGSGRGKKKKRSNAEDDFECSWDDTGLKLCSGKGRASQKSISWSRLEYGMQTR